MFELHIVKRHRWSALLNGVVIGFGIVSIMSGAFVGILPLAVGVGIEVWQRNRLSSSQA